MTSPTENLPQPHHQVRHRKNEPSPATAIGWLIVGGGCSLIFVFLVSLMAETGVFGVNTAQVLLLARVITISMLVCVVLAVIGIWSHAKRKNTGPGTDRG
jgi:hypothetical protein